MLACSDSGSGTADSSLGTSTGAEPSIGFKLATIDGGGSITEESPSVRRFASLLESLESQYPESQQEIADMSVRAQQILNEKGITESILNIMEGMNRIGPSNTVNSKYQEVVASYLVLRDKSQSHDEAVSGMSAVLSGLGRLGQ